MKTATKKNNTEVARGAVLLSAVAYASLGKHGRDESIAGLDEEIGLLLWMLEGDLSPEERREVYQRLEVLLCRKYAGGMQ